MYRRRLWSVGNARWLLAVYDRFESLLTFVYPLLARLEGDRLDRSFVVIEKAVKGFLFDSQSCGQ